MKKRFLVALSGFGLSVCASVSAGTRAPIPDTFTTSGRVVITGDLHGNLDGLVTILRKAKLIDRDGHWIGGRAIYVSPGDILDGDKDSALVVKFIARLTEEAQAAGGNVVVTYGNHEIMVSEGDELHITKAEVPLYEGAEPETHKVNSIHFFFDPETEQGRMLRSLNQVVKITQTWKSASGKAMSRSFIAVHAGLSKKALTVPLDYFNSSSRAWIRYWQYKARTKRLLEGQKDKSGDPKFVAKLEHKLKLLEQDRLPLIDEMGSPVRKPANPTAWVVGYDPRKRAFNVSDPNSPSWLRFNHIDVEKKTGKLIVADDPHAMSHDEFRAYLRNQGADFMVVGHEPTPKNDKLGIARRIQHNPRYPELINADTRIGWTGDPKIEGKLSYIEMAEGKIAFHDDVTPPRGPTRVSKRMAQAMVLGATCFKNRVEKLLSGSNSGISN